MIIDIQIIAESCIFVKSRLPASWADRLAKEDCLPRSPIMSWEHPKCPTKGVQALEVIKITPRGYCYGVVDAIQLAKQVAKDPSYPRPIHILGLIVHNRHVVESLQDEYGIISLDGPDRLTLLEQITEGTVIFTAHGVSPAVKARAKERGLTCVDATCPDVTRTHQLIKDLADKGYQIIYIGKRGHPEPEGAMGEAPGSVHLVETRKTSISSSSAMRRSR